MRIISGSAGGRRLASPPGRRTRPTSDRVREALFSILGPMGDAVVVDGFAGSGALGLEALSRGASLAYFFEISRQVVGVIEENVRRVGLEERAVVARVSFVQGLEHVVEGTPDLWFLDPPYNSGLAREGLEAMRDQKEKVTKGALVVVECDRGEEIGEVDRFAVEDERIYGGTKLVLLRVAR